jgi:hypothetical protein
MSTIMMQRQKRPSMNKKFEHGKRYLFKHEIEETIKATAMIIGVHGSQRFSLTNFNLKFLP